MEFGVFLSTVAFFLGVNAGLLSPEGCEEDWVHFNNFCYRFIPGYVHFDTALEICSVVKKSTLVTLWNQEEFHFVTENLRKIISDEESAWVGIIPSYNKFSWQWIDGSAFDIPKSDLPDPRSDVCGSLTTDGKLQFVDCELTKPAFVCKKSLEMLYLPSNFNETSALVDLDQETIIFERQRPSDLNTSLVESFRENHLATVDVEHETDCAYRCYTVDNCKAFMLRCKADRRCDSYYCSLLSGIHRDEL